MATPLPDDQIAIRLRDHPGWSFADNTLVREFAFPDHITAFGFVARASMAAEVMDHHPDLRLVYNRVEIRLSSHDAGGVTARDFRLASKIDEYS